MSRLRSKPARRPGRAKRELCGEGRRAAGGPSKIREEKDETGIEKERGGMAA